MGATGGHLYTVEVRPSRHDPGHFTWAIRDRGKLVRGSYRPHTSEHAARAVAEAEVERLIGQVRTQAGQARDTSDEGASDATAATQAPAGKRGRGKGRPKTDTALDESNPALTEA